MHCCPYDRRKRHLLNPDPAKPEPPKQKGPSKKKAPLSCAPEEKGLKFADMPHGIAAISKAWLEGMWGFPKIGDPI